MRVVTDDGTYRVMFKHERYGCSRATTCSLMKDVSVGHGLLRTRVSFGLAQCHTGDNYCKETGRKIALTRALASAGFSKPLRTQVWKAYFARKEQANDPRGEQTSMARNRS